MAGKKAAVSSGSSVPAAGSSVLLKPLHNLEKAELAFADAVNEWKTISKESIVELDFTIEQRREEIQQLEKHRIEKLQSVEDEVSQSKKRKRIDCDNDIAAYKRESALKILKDTGEIAISEDLFNQMKTELQTQKAKYEQELKDTAGSLTGKAKREQEIALRSLELEWQSKTATITAEVKQLKEQEKNYMKTIVMLEKQLDDQRQLTKEVAQAGSKGAIQQTIGK